jgi:DNA polymerase III subunit beta
MKVVVSTAELTKLISKIQSTVPSKAAIPILGNILIEATGDQLIVSATDLVVSMRAYIAANVAEEGSITVPAKRFFQLIREITTPQIEIECQSGEIAHISSGSSQFRLNGIHKSEFPSLPDLQGGHYVSLSSMQLKQMFSRTAFAAAKEDSRHVLNGILMKIENNELTFTGTDGKRLAKVACKADIDGELSGAFVIPLKGVEEIIKVLDQDEALKFFVFDDKIAIESGSVCLISKLLSGEYPDVDKVIPQETTMNVQLHREELITLLKQVSLFTTELSHSVRFTFSDGELALCAMSSEIGEGKVSMPADYNGEPIEVAFNPFYFADILRHCKDETVTFGIKDAFNPGLITDTSAAIFVLMPMRLTANQTNAA